MLSGELIQGFKCPGCKRESIVYNGNYFCDYLGNGCDWALSDAPGLWERYGYKLYLQLMKQRNKKPNPHALPKRLRAVK